VKGIDWEWLSIAIIIASLASCQGVSEYAHAKYGYGICPKTETQ